MSSCNVTNVDCSSSTQETPNPDISGVGVLIGFLATAYLTLAIVSIYYCFGYVHRDFMNSIDRGIIDTVWRKARSKPAKTWEPTFRTAVLMFSDQQLVTGIALLISGYAQLRCGLSVYHWQMIVYLSWFSSMTHLITLTVLRQCFRENLVPRLWRAILMLLMVMMLGIAILPTGDARWFDNAGSPALCCFRRLIAHAPEDRFQFAAYLTSSMLISVMFFFLGYLTRFIKLSNKATAFTRLWIRAKPGTLLKNTLNDSIQRAERPSASKYWRLKHLTLETAYVILRACFDIYESILWDIIWLAFALAWGTIHLFIARSHESRTETDVSVENTWGFGQVFPVILLALPILSIGESYYEKTQIEPGESRTSTQYAQSDAGHGSSQFLRIGQWPKETSSYIAASSIGLETHNAMRRTGTDLQNDEIFMGTVLSMVFSNNNTQLGTEAAGASHPHHVSSARNSIESKDKGLFLSHELYRFEWLIGMVLLVLFELITVLLWATAGIIPGDFIASWPFILCSLGFLLASSLLYTSIFVVLMEYHEVIEKFLDKHAHFRPGLQRTCLRASAYMYACGVIAAIASLAVFFSI